MRTGLTHCRRGHERTPANTIQRVYRGMQSNRCRRCAREDYEAKADAKRNGEASSSNAKYIPLDDLASRPIVRVLKALRFFDWVETCDLYEAIGAHTNAERNSFANVIIRLVRSGDIERRPLLFRRKQNEVRITAKGRARLGEAFADYQRRLDAVSLTDEELQECAG